MADINCFVGSVYGAAEQLANELVAIAKERGHTLNVHAPGNLKDFHQSDVVLIITSTTGYGDIPAELESLFIVLQTDFPIIKNKRFAVIAMGDSSYVDTFCYAGKKFQALLTDMHGIELIDRLDIDAMANSEPLAQAKSWFDSLLDSLKNEAH